MKGQKTGGRVAGILNKSTQEIKTLLDEDIDFRTLIKRLYRMSKRNDLTGFHSCKLLLEYRYGKPREMVELAFEASTTDIVREFANIVSNAGTGITARGGIAA